MVLAIIFLSNLRQNYSLTNNYASILDLSQDYLHFLQNYLDFLDLHLLESPYASIMLKSSPVDILAVILFF